MAHRLRVHNEEVAFILLPFIKRQYAARCHAILEFYDSSGTQIFQMRGRWINVPEISAVSPGSQFERAYYPDPIDILGDSHEYLDCLVQFISGGDVYAWNNESYFHGGRTPGRYLTPGAYQVRVTVFPQNGDRSVGRFDVFVDNNPMRTRITSRN